MRSRAAEHFDGKFVVHGNDDTPSAEDMALGYKQMIRVEQTWRDLKSTPTPEAAKCLKSSQIRLPPPILRLASQGQTSWIHGTPGSAARVVAQRALTRACHLGVSE